MESAGPATQAIHATPSPTNANPLAARGAKAMGSYAAMTDAVDRAGHATQGKPVRWANARGPVRRAVAANNAETTDAEGSADLAL